MGQNKLQDLRDSFRRGDHVLVLNHGRGAPRKATVQNVESSSCRVQYEGAGLFERVRLKDLQHDPVFAKPTPKVVPVSQQPAFAWDPQQAPRPQTTPVAPKTAFSAVATLTARQPSVEKPVERFSSFLRAWRTEHGLSNTKISKLASSPDLPEFRLGFIDTARTLAEDAELALIAIVIEHVEGKKGLPKIDRHVRLSKLKALRDADAAAGVRPRLRRVDHKAAAERKNKEAQQRLDTSLAREVKQQEIVALVVPDPLPESKEEEKPVSNTSTTPAPRLSDWFRAWRMRREYTIAQVGSRCGLNKNRISQIELRSTAAEDDELLAIAAMLEATEEPGTDWLDRLQKLRDGDLALGVRFRAHKQPRRNSPTPSVVLDLPAPALPPLPTVATLSPTETTKLETPPQRAEALPRVEQQMSPAVLQPAAVEKKKMQLTVGGVQIEGSPEDIKKLLGLG